MAEPNPTDYPTEPKGGEFPTHPFVSFDNLVSEFPDAPLPNIAAFDTLPSRGAAEIRKSVEWVEPQRTITILMKHHGDKATRQVLKMIAKAASEKKVPMLPRTRSIAEYYGFKVY